MDRQRFQEFDAVMRLYVSFKCTQKAESPTYQACNVSAVQGHGGGRQGRWVHGRGGRGRPDARAQGIVPQEEVNKVTTVKAWWYSPEEFAKFTPAKKQKHFQLNQLKKAGKIPGTGPSRKTNKSSATVAEFTSAVSAVSAAASAISELTSVTTKRNAADGETNDNDVATNSKWGQNRDNPAVAGRQERVQKRQELTNWTQHFVCIPYNPACN